MSPRNCRLAGRADLLSTVWLSLHTPPALPSRKSRSKGRKVPDVDKDSTGRSFIVSGWSLATKNRMPSRTEHGPLDFNTTQASLSPTRRSRVSVQSYRIFTSHTCCPPGNRRQGDLCWTAHDPHDHCSKKEFGGPPKIVLYNSGFMHSGP